MIECSLNDLSHVEIQDEKFKVWKTFRRTFITGASNARKELQSTEMRIFPSFLSKWLKYQNCRFLKERYKITYQFLKRRMYSSFSQHRRKRARNWFLFTKINTDRLMNVIKTLLLNSLNDFQVNQGTFNHLNWTIFHNNFSSLKLGVL